MPLTGVLPVGIFPLWKPYYSGGGKTLRIIHCLMALAVTFPVPVSGVSAGTDAPCRLVDAPTAGILRPRQYLIETQLFDGGGIVQRALVGLNSYVSAGVSYGGSGMIGSQRVIWQPHAGIDLRVRLIEESVKVPALVLGFDTQGDGPYLPGPGLNRFRYKSRGVYLAMSRNYRFFGDFGVHGGANYSLEKDDGDFDPSFWVGFDKDFGDRFDLRAEYDFASNNGDGGRLTVRHGFLNAALVGHLSKRFALEFDLRNLLRSDHRDAIGMVSDPQPSRELRIFYTGTF